MTEPIFKSIFGDDWGQLPIVMKEHYANHSFSDDVTIVEGLMTVESYGPGKILQPLFKLLGILVPYSGENIPTIVSFKSDINTDVFIFDRVFKFPGKSSYQFYSTLHPIGENQVIEVMKFGLGWKSSFVWQGGKVKLIHVGYYLKFFNNFIPLPIELLLGKGYAEEIPINDNCFSMAMEIVHPWWGKIFGYSGIFKIVKKRNEILK